MAVCIPKCSPALSVTPVNPVSLFLFPQIVEILFNALNQNLVQFELKPGVEVVVYVTQLTLGKHGRQRATVVPLLASVILGVEAQSGTLMVHGQLGKEESIPP